jgi:Cys-tRNA(Pro)/Cys-tRNA(Cys) deacylase
MKTIAARMLDQLKIAYELRSYEVSEDELDAITVARKVDMPPEATFKTLVARGDKTGVVMACIPGDKELDLKKFASATGNKRVELVPVKEIQSLTGYIRGGVSPLGSKKKYPLFTGQIRRAVAFQRAALAGTTVDQVADARAEDCAADYERVGKEVLKLVK